LFEDKINGIFAISEEQLKLPKPTDEKIMSVFYAKYVTKDLFVFTIHDKKKLEFTIKHYAFDVKYNGSGFVDKNRNNIADEIFTALRTSTDSLINDIYFCSTKKQLSTPSSNSSTSLLSTSPGRKDRIQGGNKIVSLALQFSKQLQDLIDSIRLTKSHFIRCFKPNSLMLPNNFNTQMMKQQLKASGALEAIEVFFLGYPNRVTFQNFVNRYSSIVAVIGSSSPIFEKVCDCILEARQSGLLEVWKLAASKLVKIIPIIENVFYMLESQSRDMQNIKAADFNNGMKLGKTQIFLKSKIYDYLEEMNERAIHMFITRIQRLYRYHRLRKDLLLHTSDKYKMNSNTQIKNSISLKCIIYALISFSDHKKKKCVKYVAAIVTLQRFVKFTLSKLGRFKYLRKITLVQSCWRGYKIRLCRKIAAIGRNKLKYSKSFHFGMWSRLFSMSKAKRTILRKYLVYRVS
jgi:myosin heavy subunit